MKIKKMAALLVLYLFNGLILQAQTPGEMISAMEKKMFVNGKSELSLNSRDSQGNQEDYKFMAYAKENNQRIILRITFPPKIMGNDMLFQDRNVWVLDKKTSREMKIPANQSFGGTGLSYGDVLRLNYSSNFVPSIVETLEDGWILNLAAKERDAPYFRVVLEISRDFSPRKGTCYSRTGEVVKTMVWEDLRDAGTGVRPQKLTVTSPLEPQAFSTLTIHRETREDYPDNIFNKRNLSARLEEKL